MTCKKVAQVFLDCPQSNTLYKVNNSLVQMFDFAEVEEIGLCYIKVNCFNRIEEIGFDIQQRMCRAIGDIMKSAKKATKIHRHIFTSIDIEYWGKIRNQWLRSVKTQTYIENNSGTIIL